jgi:hypothetical protein
MADKKVLKFVEVGMYSINPWAVASVYEDEKCVYIMLLSGVYYTVPKYQGDIIVNDKKCILSALELAANSVITDE